MICVCVCSVCVFIKLHIARNPALSSKSFYATRIDPPKGGSIIIITKTSCFVVRHSGDVRDGLRWGRAILSLLI